MTRGAEPLLYCILLRVRIPYITEIIFLYIFFFKECGSAASLVGLGEAVGYV